MLKDLYNKVADDINDSDSDSEEIRGYKNEDDLYNMFFIMRIHRICHDGNGLNVTEFLNRYLNIDEDEEVIKKKIDKERERVIGDNDNRLNYVTFYQNREGEKYLGIEEVVWYRENMFKKNVVIEYIINRM